MLSVAHHITIPANLGCSHQLTSPMDLEVKGETEALAKYISLLFDKLYIVETIALLQKCPLITIMVP